MTTTPLGGITHETPSGRRRKAPAGGTFTSGAVRRTQATALRDLKHCPPDVPEAGW
jgi:hypothetical protein